MVDPMLRSTELTHSGISEPLSPGVPRAGYPQKHTRRFCAGSLCSALVASEHPDHRPQCFVSMVFELVANGVNLSVEGGMAQAHEVRTFPD